MDELTVGLIILAVVLVVTITVFFIVKKKKKGPQFDYEKFVELLGGFDNIEEASYKNSRLCLTIKDKKEVKRDELIDMGASAIVVNSKKVTLIMGVLSNSICAYILKNKG